MPPPQNGQDFLLKFSLFTLLTYALSQVRSLAIAQATRNLLKLKKKQQLFADVCSDVGVFINHILFSNLEKDLSIISDLSYSNLGLNFILIQESKHIIIYPRLSTIFVQYLRVILIFINGPFIKAEKIWQ